MDTGRKDANVQIGKRLREARLNMNLEKSEIADVLGVTVEHYRKLEAGTTGISVDKVLVLSRLVDTFSSRILYPMLLLSGNHSIAVVWPSGEALHWWSRSSGYSSS